MFFNSRDVIVKHAGETFTLVKNETYGYRSTRGAEFRFVDNKEYRILNPGEDLLLYVYKHPAHSPKEAERYAPAYFFSSDAASAPRP